MIKQISDYDFMEPIDKGQTMDNVKMDMEESH